MPEEEHENTMYTPHEEIRKQHYSDLMCAMARDGADIRSCISGAALGLSAFDNMFPAPPTAAEQCRWVKVGLHWHADCGHIQEDTHGARAIAMCSQCNKVIRRVANGGDDG